MEPENLQEYVNAAINALETYKEQVQGTSEQVVAPQGEQLQAIVGEAIANLNAQLGKMAQATQPAEQQAPQEKAVEVVEPAPVNTVDTEPQAPPSVAAAGHKFIEVPRRQRTGDARQGGVQLKPFTLELPATPFHPKTNGSESVPPKTAQRTPGIPASTPMAAEVLASLCALGLQFPVAGQNAVARAPAMPAPRRAAVQAVAAAPTVAPMPASFARRAAAVRAAEASASLARPVKKVPLAPAAAPETIARKSCNCKRSQCLKLYCECFAAGGFCLPGCQCYNCLNTKAEKATVEATRAAILSKNPRAFTDKVVGDAHKKGCRCKRSKCLKKYCECYNAGVKCNPEICQCAGCHNTSDRNPEDAEYGEEPLAYDMDDEYDYDDELDVAADKYVNKDSAPVATNENAQVNVIYEINNNIPGSESMQWTAGTLNALDAAPFGAAGVAGISPVEEPKEDNNTDPVRQLVMNAVAKAVAAEEEAAAEPVIAEEADNTIQQQQQHHLQSIAAALKPIAPIINNAVNNNLGAEVVTPGGPLGAGPSALVSHLSDMGLDGDVDDTAASPAVHAAAVQARLAAQAHLNRRMAGGTMTAAAAKAAGLGGRTKSQTYAADTPEGSLNSSGADGSQVRGKRPRRAASGGVQGAVAAATSDWGLDIVSPPPKRSNSVPDAMDLGKGTAAAARRDRNTLLRRALQNDAAVAAAQGQHLGTEADAISALVSMNMTMS